MDSHEVEDRVQKMEYAIWGLSGNNGLVSQLRLLRQEMNDWRLAELQKQEQARKERKSDIRWRIGTAIAVVSAILVAAGIVASAL